MFPPEGGREINELDGRANIFRIAAKKGPNPVLTAPVGFNRTALLNDGWPRLLFRRVAGTTLLGVHCLSELGLQPLGWPEGQSGEANLSRTFG